MTATTLRPAEVVLDPVEMGAARYTRHSFARCFLRTAARERWTLERECWQLDAAGRGEVVYRVRAGRHIYRFVAFSTTLTEDQRTDRVVADAWDVTAALIEGELTPERWADLRTQVPRQEGGRADANTFIWTRANRSARFFDYVVDRLSAGQQPDVAAMGDDAYVLRSTAFYGNGKFGMADFDRIPPQHPLHLPYRSQMVAAWLLRELSYDLVEHCARARNPHAACLNEQWRRYLGLGNATGLGMVPYIVNHPQVLHAWCLLRELPLAHVLSQPRPDSAAVTRVSELLSRAIGYFAERNSLATAPYTPGPDLAAQLTRIAERLPQVLGTDHPWTELREYADTVGREARAVLDSILIESDPTLDSRTEQLLRCDETTHPEPASSCGQLRALIVRHYAWARAYGTEQPGGRQFFWFSSQNNEEPRRGRRDLDPGEQVEHPLGIAHQVNELLADLDGVDPRTTVAEFMLGQPWHRGTVARVQALHQLPYSEVRTNLLAADFLPLHLQRFQLAIYGMENYSPQSTDWLRVTLYSGAPRAADVAAGIDDDWMFARKPERHPS